MLISVCVAMDRKGLIGRSGDNGLPWGRIPEDMRRFREVTMGRPCVMGRKTWESIPPESRPLPGRRNIVVTRSIRRSWSEDDREPSFLDLNDTISWINQRKPEEVIVIGGSQIYREFLPLADRIYLTLIRGDHEGDVYFPECSRSDWETETDDCDPRSKCTFMTLTRRPGTGRTS